MISVEVIKILDLVNSDDPVFAGESFFQGRELGAFGGELRAADAVGGLAGGEERVVVVVGHFVHQAVLHGLRGLVVDAVFAAGGEVVALFDLVGPDAFGDTDHPQELVDVVAGVADQTTKDDEDIVDLVLSHDGVADLLAGAHGLANSGNVGVVPGVVVDKSRTVGHTTDLVTVIPPGHDLGVLLGVLTEPVVSLTVVVDNVLRAIGHLRSQDNRRG
jgi:hypothetical protein